MTSKNPAHAAGRAFTNNSSNIRQSFNKQERLCSKLLMDDLFKRGRSLSAYPLKLVFLQVDTPLLFPAQAMFVAPKRSFKLSPDRNLLKRRMREAYRLSKYEFYKSLAGKKMTLAIIYTGRKIDDYSVIEKSVKKLLGQVT